MRTLLRVVVAVLAVVGAAAIVFALVTIRGGFTARAKASMVESEAADALRSLATSRSARNQRSPIPGTPDAVMRGRRHFAAECATCHGNDGKGSDFGRRLFPPVPNLRDDTRDLTEGEIFYVIQNGIRWSGMPSFIEPDDPEAAREHWEVVHFIRHLPDLTEAEIAEMKRYNPRTPPHEDAGPPAPAPQEMAPAPGEAAGHPHGEAQTPTPAAPTRRGRAH